MLPAAARSLGSDPGKPLIAPAFVLAPNGSPTTASGLNSILVPAADDTNRDSGSKSKVLKIAIPCALLGLALLGTGLLLLHRRRGLREQGLTVSDESGTWRNAQVDGLDLANRSTDKLNPNNCADFARKVCSSAAASLYGDEKADHPASSQTYTEFPSPARRSSQRSLPRQLILPGQIYAGLSSQRRSAAGGGEFFPTVRAQRPIGGREPPFLDDHSSARLPAVTITSPTASFRTLPSLGRCSTVGSSYSRESASPQQEQHYPFSPELAPAPANRNKPLPPLALHPSVQADRSRRVSYCGSNLLTNPFDSPTMASPQTMGSRVFSESRLRSPMVESDDESEIGPLHVTNGTLRSQSSLES